MLKKKKAAFLPLILADESYKEKYRQGFMIAYDEYLKERKFLLPHQGESAVSTTGTLSLFQEIRNSAPGENINKWSEIGVKIRAEYLIIVRFLKPDHVKFKNTHREIVYITDKSTQSELPRQVTVFIDTDMWYQKGEIMIIDVEKKALVYHLKKETKAGYSRRSSRGYGPSTFREAISSLGSEEIPSLKNVIYLFFKGIFKSWN